MILSTEVSATRQPQQKEVVSIANKENGGILVVRTAEPNFTSDKEIDLLHLSDEILSVVLTYVPPHDLLIYTTRTCHRFANIVLRSDSFWKHHPLVNSKISVAADSKQQQQKLPILNQFQLQLYCLYRAATAVSQTTVHVPSFLKYESVLAHPQNLPLSPSYPRTLRLYQVVCAATSTDHADTESLENVLDHLAPYAHAQYPPPRNNHHRRESFPSTTLRRWTGLLRMPENFGGLNVDNPRWWSSAPGDPDSNEVLVFTTNARYCILSEVWFKPLRDPFTRMVVFTSRKIVIRAYLLEPVYNHQQLIKPQQCHDLSPNMFCGPNPCSFYLSTSYAVDGPSPATVSTGHSMMEDLRRRRAAAAAGKTTIEALLKDQIPVYESPEYDVDAQDDSLQKFSFPKNQGVVANVVTITLIGKNFEQFRGSGYYACVEQVDCHGIPLFESSRELESAL